MIHKTINLLYLKGDLNRHCPHRDTDRKVKSKTVSLLQPSAIPPVPTPALVVIASIVARQFAVSGPVPRLSAPVALISELLEHLVLLLRVEALLTLARPMSHFAAFVAPIVLEAVVAAVARPMAHFAAAEALFIQPFVVVVGTVARNVPVFAAVIAPFVHSAAVPAATSAASAIASAPASAAIVARLFAVARPMTDLSAAVAFVVVAVAASAAAAIPTRSATPAIATAAASSTAAAIATAVVFVGRALPGEVALSAAVITHCV